MIEADTNPTFEAHGLSVRRQGERPTCSVFAFSSVVEYAMSVADRGRLVGRLSVEYLNWAASTAAGHKQDGAFFSDLIAGLKTYGACPETDWPYAEAYDPALEPSAECTSNAERLDTDSLSVAWIKEWDPETGLDDDQVDLIKATLGRGYPVCVGMRWPKAPVLSEGVLQMCNPDEVRDGHSVVIAGFTQTTSGGEVFAIRDSGRCGPAGLLPRDYVQAYTNDALWIKCDSRAE